MRALMCHGLVILSSLSLSVARSMASDKVLLTNVKTLTLRKGEMTSARRVSPIPQLHCVGGSAKGLYDVDVLRCTNQGTDYDPNNVQWTCVASLPLEFKLGSTDVICEGYDSPDDPNILKGSCGVEYRLVLTQVGEEKYAKARLKSPSRAWDPDTLLKYAPWLPWNTAATLAPSQRSWTAETIVNYIFMSLLLILVLAIIISSILSYFATPTTRRRPNTAPRNHGGGGPGNDDDPPPPYDPRPPQPKPQPPRPKPKARPAPAASSSSSSQSNQSWRPGFWTGAAGGAAAGYMAGRANSSRATAAQERYAEEEGSREQELRWRAEEDRRRRRWSWEQEEEEQARRMGSRPPGDLSWSSPSYSSTTYESTGFGETRRR